ncbi:MAG: hypothetical protein PHF35_00650 [Candidatus Moranbacteria bacterium]|nr:hypothetical protein [Candidatus Moranbacteria bacterium]
MLKSKFFKNNLIYLAGTVFAGFLGYLFHFVVSRRLSVAEYGQLQSLLSLSAIFGVANSALSYFSVKHTAVFAAHDDFQASENFLEYLLPKVWKYALAFVIIILTLSPFFARLLHFSTYLGFFAVSFASLFSIIAVPYQEILRGWHKFFLLTSVGVITAFVKLFVGAGIALASPGAASISFSIFVSAIFSWYLAHHLSRRLITKKGNKSSLEKNFWRDKYFSETGIRKTAQKIFVFSLFVVLITNIDVILVKYFSSPDIAGYFGAFNLLGKIILWLNLAVVAVMLPEACAAGHSKKKPGSKKILLSYGFIAAISISIISFFRIFPDFTINLFFGEKYIFDPSLLWIFGFFSFLISILTLEANLAFARHDWRVNFFLAATLFLMVVGIGFYHASLTQIVSVFSAVFLIGYTTILGLNLYSAT